MAVKLILNHPAPVQPIPMVVQAYLDTVSTILTEVVEHALEDLMLFGVATIPPSGIALKIEKEINGY